VPCGQKWNDSRKYISRKDQTTCARRTRCTDRSDRASGMSQHFGMHVLLCVALSSCFFAHFAYWHGCVLLWRIFATCCCQGFYSSSYLQSIEVVQSRTRESKDGYLFSSSFTALLSSKGEATAELKNNLLSWIATHTRHFLCSQLFLENTLMILSSISGSSHIERRNRMYTCTTSRVLEPLQSFESPRAESVGVGLGISFHFKQCNSNYYDKLSHF
jgi:hypothetical protein